MKKENEVVHKPSNTIMISNGDITPTQRKTYNLILQKAWLDLKLNNNQTLFSFDISDLKERAGIESKDDNRFKDDIKKLRHIDIETVKENGDWSIFSLISQVERKGNLLEVELPKKIRQALIENKYYTTLDLLVLKTLKGKYAVIIFEIVTRYKGINIPEFTIEELRKLTGTENKKSYNDFGVFRQKVLEPAIEEINEKTETILSYEPTQKQGKKVIALRFKTKLKNTKIEIPLPADAEEDPNLKMYFDMFKDVSGFEIDLTDLKSLIKDYGEGKILKYITNYRKFAFATDSNINFKINSFKKAIRDEWPIPSHERKKPQNMDFDQRQYSDEDFDKCLSNGNHKREAF